MLRGISIHDEALIIRNKRGGSYLSDAEKISRDYRFFAYLDDDGESIIPVTNEHFAIDLVDNRGPWSDFLNDSKHYVYIARTIRLRDEFRILSSFYLVANPFKSLMSVPEREIRNTSIKNVLRIRFNLLTLRTEWHMRSVSIDNYCAKKLCEDSGTLCNQFDVYGYSLHDAPLFFHRFTAPCNNRIMKIIT